MIQLWEFAGHTLSWFPLRKVEETTVDANLAALREGTPHGMFVASYTQPTGNPRITGKLKNVRGPRRPQHA